MYTLKEINDKNTWNNFIIDSNFEFYSFLQSFEWGELQETLGKKTLRYGIYQREKCIGCMLILKIYAKRGNYYFIPHGPLIIGNFFEVISGILPQIKEKAKQDKMDFIRFNSTQLNTLQNKDAFQKLGFIDAPMHEHAEDTHLLDLTPSIDALLDKMDKKDRYYITRAQKEGVEVRIDNHQDHRDILAKMHQEHAKKIGYHPFTLSFINNMYQIFGENITTISTKYHDHIESILMTIKFGKTCVYYIATSDITQTKFSPNYLCQWEAIKKAKNDGASLYNFWGVSPDDNPKHPIAGVSKFKRKFCGYDYSLIHAQDYVLSKKYYFNWIIETIRRIKRGYYYKKPI